MILKVGKYGECYGVIERGGDSKNETQNKTPEKRVGEDVKS